MNSENPRHCWYNSSGCTGSSRDCHCVCPNCRNASREDGEAQARKLNPTPVKPERQDPLVAIKQRQQAANSSLGTKALIIQTFSEDLPWLIKEIERLRLENIQLLNTVETLSNSDTIKGLVAGLKDIQEGRFKPLSEIRKELNSE